MHKLVFFPEFEGRGHCSFPEGQSWPPRRLGALRYGRSPLYSGGPVTVRWLYETAAPFPHAARSLAVAGEPAVTCLEDLQSGASVCYTLDLAEFADGTSALLPCGNGWTSLGWPISRGGYVCLTGLSVEKALAWRKRHHRRLPRFDDMWSGAADDLVILTNGTYELSV